MDDIGYSDISVYGREFGNLLTETPNIDELASEGMMFTQAYAPSPLCSPSRASLLTGKSPARLNFEFVTKYEGSIYDNNDEWAKHWSARQLVPPPFALNLPLEEVTMAEMLRDAGYETGICGKWHVAAHHQHYLGWSKTHGPKQQGFDYAAETFGSHPYRRYDEEMHSHLKPLEIGEYPKDELTDKASEFLKRTHEQPFFLFVSHYYAHTPLDTVAPWLLDKYKQKGGEGITNARILYAAFIETLDHYIGNLLSALESSGHAENTLVILTSDNGGHPNTAFNRPFRGSKWNLYEGGIRVPMIIRWPGVVTPGQTSASTVIQTDIMPTLREILSIDEDSNIDCDGVSILPILKQSSISKAERTVTWHFPYYHPEGKEFEKAKQFIGIEDGYISQTTPQSAIRSGDMKLVYFYADERTELYDLSNDVKEENDLSGDSTALASELKDKLLEHLEKSGARTPQPNKK